MPRPWAWHWDAARELQLADGMRLFQAQRPRSTKGRISERRQSAAKADNCAELTLQPRASRENGKLLNLSLRSEIVDSRSHDLAKVVSWQPIGNL